MKTRICKIIVVVLVGIVYASAAFAQECVECHKEVTPNIVSDWQLSTHSENEVECFTCHGEEHKTAEDFAELSYICLIVYRKAPVTQTFELRPNKGVA